MAYKVVTYDNLSRYDSNIKNYISEQDAKAYKTIIADSVANRVYFYKKEGAVAGTDTPDFLLNVNFIPLIENATGSKIAVTAANGTVAEGSLAISDLASMSYIGSIPSEASATTVVGYIDEAVSGASDDLSSEIASLRSDLSSLSGYVGEIPAGATASTVTDYVDEAIDTAINALDSSATIADKTGNQVNIYPSISEVDGIISINTSNPIVLASVATTGAAADVALSTSYTTIDESSTASDVETAIGLIGSDITTLASQSAGGVASKTVWFRDASASQSEYAKVYKLYQGANSPEDAEDPATLIGTINTPKDEVLQDAMIVTITFDDGKLYDGLTDVTALIKGAGESATAADAGKYMKFIIQNVIDPLYANLSEFIDIYTAQENASQVQIVIDNNNVISATIVAGSITATELSTDAVTTVKILDENVTKAKLSSSVQASLDLADSALQSADFEAITNAEIDALFA